MKAWNKVGDRLGYEGDRECVGERQAEWESSE